MPRGPRVIRSRDNSRPLPPERSEADRDLILRIKSVDDESFEFTPMGGALANVSFGTSFVRLIPEVTLNAHLDALRTAWSTLVDTSVAISDQPGDGFRHPFQDNWSLRKAPEYLAKHGPALAEAGLNLFAFLFLEDQDGETVGDRKRREWFVQRFREVAAKQRKLIITVCSDDLFVPWQMLYLHPDVSGELEEPGDNYASEGFWGIRHEVEHCPTDMCPDARIHPDVQSRTVIGGLHFDKSMELDVEYDVVERQRTFFEKHPHIRRIERFYKRELIKALKERNLKDHIMYFLCHGKGRGSDEKPNPVASSLSLTREGKGVQDYQLTAKDFETNLKDHELNPGPLVFCNACQGGQMTTLFYEAIPKVLLRKGAISLIGPQIDIPAVFADKISQRFFTSFVNGPTKPARTVTSVLRTLSRSLFNTHNNPLGLAYSVYRGIDVAIDWGSNGADGG